MPDASSAGSASPAAASVRGIDLHIDRPHPARIYDYFLGGKDNFPADRAAAEAAIQTTSNVRTGARENRAFMGRTMRCLAGELGIRQFLDIGTGIPTSPNLHEIVQGITPEARIVYVDNDPIVLTHARALLASSAAGRVTYLDSDIRDVRAILTSPQLTGTLDLTQPVALSLIAVLHFMEGDEPYAIVRELLDALVPGSYLVLSHGTADPDPVAKEVEDRYHQQGVSLKLRSRGEVQRLFDGLTLMEPGLQIVHRWRPDADTDLNLTDAEVCIYGAVGRK
ncbi:Methyltransferase [Frankia sp. AiPs1]|uniref:SAM-dependent methyltransferase n=1 Tax=Frankia sp. AiPa1 TaxID=573492 RepID=UPI00202AE415|nr:SAM-dependent methyltransferase [Frankia sp. AiPa1]MCL9762197.1 SAM-dependent methyltransferase [Frankia sp. AiPa1]